MTSFPLARYRLECEVRTPLRLPDYAGSTLRGAFGGALRAASCMTKQKLCDGCPLLATCPYAAIFETRPPAGGTTLQDFSQVPRPYVIEPPNWGARDYAPGEALAFHLVLAGRALEQLPLLLWAFALARGVGKGEGTAELRIAEIARHGHAAIVSPERTSMTSIVIPRASPSRQARHPQHARRFQQAVVEGGEAHRFSAGRVQRLGGRQLDAVVAAQGEDIGKFAGLFDECLRDFDDQVIVPVVAQVGARLIDGGAVGGHFAQPPRQGSQCFGPGDAAHRQHFRCRRRLPHRVAAFFFDVKLDQCRGVAEQDHRLSSVTMRPTGVPPSASTTGAASAGLRPLQLTAFSAIRRRKGSSAAAAIPTMRAIGTLCDRTSMTSPARACASTCDSRDLSSRTAEKTATHTMTLTANKMDEGKQAEPFGWVFVRVDR